LPSSFDLPLPTEITSPCCGFSLAESGMMMPPILLSPSSMRRTRIRSCSGVNDDVAIALHLLMRFVANGVSVRVVLRDQLRQPRRNLPQRSWRNLANRHYWRELLSPKAHLPRPISTQASRLLKIFIPAPHVKSPM